MAQCQDTVTELEYQAGALVSDYKVAMSAQSQLGTRLHFALDVARM